MSVDIETVVVGAGVVGLAVARSLAMAGREVLILEAEQAFGMQTSARNSEVIHAGIYYAKDSLKALHCVRGKQLLYAHCESHGVAYNRCGKLIVATSSSQVDTLQQVRRKAADNGVDDLQLMNQAQVRELEPAIDCEAALFSPSTGIVDSHGLMLSLLGEAENHHAVIAFGATVESIAPTQGGHVVTVGGDEAMTLTAAQVVNCAGLGACGLACDTTALMPGLIPQPVLAKGNYFQLQGKAPVSRLIYPVPVEGGLGVHITLDLAGQVRFGPDVQWIEDPAAALDYNVDPSRAESFYAAIRDYWPALPDDSLVPDYAGMRPKIRVGNAIHTDFMLQGPSEHGVDGLVNLYGIESPGLTASLSLAQQVTKLLADSS